jgi:hypothetical protein
VSVNLLKGLLNSKNISNLDRLLCCVTGLTTTVHGHLKRGLFLYIDYMKYSI